MSFAFASLFRIPITLIRHRKAPISTSTLFAGTLSTSGRALALGAVAGALATWGRMRGREDVEWQDRSWRILENKGEVDTDWVVTGGAGAGALAGMIAARRGAVPISVGAAALGGAGLGSAVGIPFMIGTFATGRKPHRV